MEIRIGKSASTCCRCERGFQHDEELSSLVRISEGALEREDYCPACWGEAGSEGAYSVWRTKFYDPKVAEQEPPEVFSPLRQLFYEAVECEERAELAKAYLAAQLLKRQKVFRQLRESDEGGGETRLVLYSDRIGNRLIEVRDPSFTYAEMEVGRRLLLERLRELEAPQVEDTEEPEEAEAEAEASEPVEQEEAPEDGQPEEESPTANG